MRTGARAGRCFVILLTLCATLIMVAPGAAQDPTVVDRQLSLQIDTANDTANVSGEFWRVKTADGTTYTFGKTEDAEQVIWPMEVTPVTQPPGPPRNESQFRNP